MRDEFPGLTLCWRAVRGVPGPSTPPLRRRLRELSDRFTGPEVVAMRTRPVASAYRTFYRHIGLDPDVTRVPAEQAAVARLLDGGFRSQNRLGDALLIAVVETGVPVWALDGARVAPETLSIRTSVAGEALGRGERALSLPPGRLVIADHQRVHGLLFGPLAAGHAARPGTRRLLLFSVGVPGVPAVHIEEALWLSGQLIAGH